LGTRRWWDLRGSFVGLGSLRAGSEGGLGSGDQLHSVLSRFALQGGKFTLLTATIKFFSAAIFPDLSSGY